MDKLSLTIDNELAILEKYQISPNELFTIRILLLAKEEYNPEYVFRFLAIPEEMRGDLRSTLISLQNKGIILKSYKIPNKGEQFYPEQVDFAVNFLKTFYRASFDMGKELFEAYPAFTNINGVTYGLRNIARKFDSLEDFFRFYGKSIRHNPAEHEHILECLNWALENTNFINFGICEFVISQKWKDIEILMSGDYDGVNFSAIRSL